MGFGLTAVSHITPYSNWQLVDSVLNEVRAGDIDHVAEQSFAFALSSAIVQLALAFAFAIFVAHVLLLRAALYTAKRDLGPDRDLRGFATRFDAISERLAQNAIVRHAWRQFEQTAIRRDDAVHNTVRPQNFINLADAREYLFGLKMMGSIPGFFVGLGLLLTFIGLVLALNKAAASTGAHSAEAMTNSLSELLAAATFKFSTSIAGLGSSLLLSLLFRSYQIWIEGAFNGFGRALEERMIFQPPQRVAADSLNVLAAQRDELKQINSEGFFARLGDTVAPRLQHAMQDAISPISETLDRTVKTLAQTSQTGVDDLVRTFMESLNQGAGRELTEVARTLTGLRESIERTQKDLAGSGNDFSSNLAKAADTMTQVVTDAARALGGSATGVAGAVDAAMASVVEKLEAQTSAFGTGLATLQADIGGQMRESARVSREAGQETAAVVLSSMREVVASLRDDIGQLSGTIRAVSGAIAGQTDQINAVTARSRDTADAFGRAASDVRSASQPLLVHSERVANSTDRMAASIESSVGALSVAEDAARSVAEQLSAHLTQIGRVWDQYEARFKNVDEDFGKAADRFHTEVSRHQEAMRDFVKDIDEHTKEILSKVSSAVAGLNESVEALHETMDGFLRTFPPAQAAE